jgi:hypothetical protein
MRPGWPPPPPTSRWTSICSYFYLNLVIEVPHLPPQTVPKMSPLSLPKMAATTRPVIPIWQIRIYEAMGLTNRRSAWPRDLRCAWSASTLTPGSGAFESFQQRRFGDKVPRGRPLPHPECLAYALRIFNTSVTTHIFQHRTLMHKIRGSSVCVVTRLWPRRPEFGSRQRQEFFALRHRLCGLRSLLSNRYRFLSPRGKTAGAWSWPLPPPSSELKNAWSYTWPPPRVFMPWYFVTHRDNFTFTLIDHGWRVSWTVTSIVTCWDLKPISVSR